MSTMNYIIRFVSDTRGTVTVTSDPFDVRTYNLRAGKREEKQVDNSLEVRLADGSVAANLDELRTLNLMLGDAFERNQKHNKRIDPVYAEWIETTGGTVWRSEVMNAKADWIEESLQYGYWINDTQFADLDFTRVNYWEGPEAQVPLTNPNGTANTAGLNVYNCNDGAGTVPNARYNYVDIAGTAVIGDLPGATRVEMTNEYASNRLASVWIGQNWTNPSTFNHWLEAEDADTSGTATADAGYSGGTAISYGIPDSSETEILSWSISAAQLGAAAGGYFKALMRFAPVGLTPDANVRYKLKIQYNLIDLWSTEYLTLDSNRALLVRDLATFQLPPWLPGLTGLSAIDLVVSAYHTLGGTKIEYFDAFQVTPVDGWRAMHYIGYGTPQNSRIVDDGINGYLYQDDGSGTNKIGIYIGYGRPILLKPGTNQRLYFQLHSNTANSAPIARYISLKLFYRPRRLTL